MSAHVRAELRSMRGSRALVWTVVGGIAIAVVAALSATAHTLTDLLRTEVIVLTLFALVAGAIAGAGEFQHRTVVWTLLACPGRLAAGMAKIVAGAILGAALAAAMLVVTWLVGDLQHGAPGAELVAGQLALGALSAVCGLAAGMALRNLPAAVAAVFTAALIIPVVFEAKPSLAEAARFLPFGEASAAAQALGGAPATAGPQLAMLAGGAVLAAWTGVLCAAALMRLTRDV